MGKGVKRARPGAPSAGGTDTPAKEGAKAQGEKAVTGKDGKARAEKVRVLLAAWRGWRWLSRMQGSSCCLSDP
jgi:hypothetical protein